MSDYLPQGKRQAPGGRPPKAGHGLSLRQENELLRGQQCILQMIATGAVLGDTLDQLVGFIESQEPDARCAILVLDMAGDHFSASFGPGLPTRYHEWLQGMPVTPPYRAPSAMTVRDRATVMVTDIAADERWSAQWRELAISCGVCACRTSLIQGSDGTVLGSFVLFHEQPGDPQPRHPQVLDIATWLASIALERARADATLSTSERDANQLLMTLPVALYTTDAVGRLTFYNAAAEVLWGYRPVIGQQNWCESWRLYWPDGTPMPPDQCHAAVALREERAFCMEICAERPDGTRVPQLAYPMPLHDESGKLSGSVTMLVDISERKQAEEQRQLLVNELNHRVKNTLATVLSIAVQTLHGARPAEAAARAFEKRIVALAKTHDILTRNSWQHASLRQVLEQELAPYCGERLHRCQVTGDDFRLAPKAALALGLAFHELATNAAKYGSLSSTAGAVEVDWQLTGDMPQTVLRVTWRESGGPPVVEPSRKGFGVRLIERGLSYELEGEVQMRYAPSGVVCTIDIPLMYRSREPVAVPLKQDNDDDSD